MYVTVRGSPAGGGAASVGAVLGAAVAVGDTLVMVSGGSAVADGALLALGVGAALG